MPNTIAIHDSDFDSTITKSSTPILVDFWAPWCGPCRALNPILEQLAEHQGEALIVAKLNIDENEATAQRFGVRSIPTLVLFEDGQEIGRHVGVLPAARLDEWIRTLRSTVA
jgi:thioredoxin 1